MSAGNTNIGGGELSGTMPFHDQHDEKKWHVIYAHARHEKKIHDQMTAMGLESFLPMRKELHEWSDRKKWVEVPLFAAYAFANITASEKNRVYLLDGFVKFVSINGRPSIVPQWQIDGIKNMIDSYPEEVEVLSRDYVGAEGTIIGGPLEGLKGIIVDVKNRKRFALKIDGIEGMLSVTIPASLFRPAARVSYIAYAPSKGGCHEHPAPSLMAEQARQRADGKVPQCFSMHTQSSSTSIFMAGPRDNLEKLSAPSVA